MLNTGKVKQDFFLYHPTFFFKLYLFLFQGVFSLRFLLFSLQFFSRIGQTNTAVWKKAKLVINYFVLNANGVADLRNIEMAGNIYDHLIKKADWLKE